MVNVLNVCPLNDNEYIVSTLLGMMVFLDPLISVLYLVFIIALQFSRESYTLLVSSTVISSKAAQFAKTSPRSCFTPFEMCNFWIGVLLKQPVITNESSGNTICFKYGQSLKLPVIKCKELGISTLRKALLQKLLPPRNSNELLNVTDWRNLQLENPRCAMLFKELGNVRDVILPS